MVSELLARFQALPESLAATLDNVVAELVNQRDIGVQTRPDQPVDRGRVLGDKGAQLVDIRG